MPVDLCQGRLRLKKNTKNECKHAVSAIGLGRIHTGGYTHGRVGRVGGVGGTLFVDRKRTPTETNTSHPHVFFTCIFPALSIPFWVSSSLRTLMGNGINLFRSVATFGTSGWWFDSNLRLKLFSLDPRTAVRSPHHAAQAQEEGVKKKKEQRQGLEARMHDRWRGCYLRGMGLCFERKKSGLPLATDQ